MIVSRGLGGGSLVAFGLGLSVRALVEAVKRIYVAAHTAAERAAVVSIAANIAAMSAQAVSSAQTREARALAAASFVRSYPITRRARFVADTRVPKRSATSFDTRTSVKARRK